MQWLFAFLEIYVAIIGNFVCNFAEPPFAIPGISIMQQIAMADAPLYEIEEVRDQLEKWLTVTRSRQSDEQANQAKHC